jgi:hypothetical protein
LILEHLFLLLFLKKVFSLIICKIFNEIASSSDHRNL